MDGIALVIKLTGKPPVYPGHPLVVAVQIMHAFPDLDAASAPTEHNWAAAIGSLKVEGGGGEVAAGLEVLRAGGRGRSVDEMIRQADQYWTQADAGGHVVAVGPGMEQARTIESHFRRVAPSWLKGHGIDGKRGA